MSDDIAAQAFRDNLTNFNNKNALNLLKPQIIANMMGAIKQGIIYSLLYIDVNGLKMLNDSKGHANGDMELALIGETILGCIRSEPSDRSDIFVNVPKILNENGNAFRIGGDEFLVVLKDCDKMCAERVKSRIQNAIKNLRDSKQLEYLSVAIGISDTTDIDFSCIKNEKDFASCFEEMEKIAERDMYEDKAKVRTEEEKTMAILAALNRLIPTLGINITDNRQFYNLLEVISSLRVSMLEIAEINNLDPNNSDDFGKIISIIISNQSQIKKSK